MATELPRLKIADQALEFPPRCSSAVFRIKDRDYRLDFWPDRDWALLLPEDRPAPVWRMLTDDGFFTITPT